MITIKRFPKEYCTLYDPSNKKIGRIYSEMQMNDVLIQIKTNNLDGYYIVLKGIKFAIDNNGRIPLRMHVDRNIIEESFLNISYRQMNQLMGF